MVTLFGLCDDEFFERFNVCLGASDNDIGIRTMSSIDTSIFNFFLRAHRMMTISGLYAHDDFAESINAFGDSMNIELEQRVGHIDNSINGFVGGINRASAKRGISVVFAIGTAQTDR